MPKRTTNQKSSLDIDPQKRQFENTTNERIFAQNTFRKKQAEQVDRTNHFKSLLGLGEAVSQAVDKYSEETPEEKQAKAENDRRMFYIAQDRVNAVSSDQRAKLQDISTNPSKYSDAELKELSSSFAEQTNKTTEEVINTIYTDPKEGETALLRTKAMHHFGTNQTDIDKILRDREVNTKMKIYNGNMNKTVADTLTSTEEGRFKWKQAEAETQALLKYREKNPEFSLQNASPEEALEYQEEVKKLASTVEPASRSEIIQDELNRLVEDAKLEGFDYKPIVRNTTESILRHYGSSDDPQIEDLELLSEIQSNGVPLSDIYNKDSKVTVTIDDLKRDHNLHAQKQRTSAFKRKEEGYKLAYSETADNTRNTINETYSWAYDRKNANQPLSEQESKQLVLAKNEEITKILKSTDPMFDGAVGAKRRESMIKEVNLSFQTLETRLVDTEMSDQFRKDYANKALGGREEILKGMPFFDENARKLADRALQKLDRSEESKAKNKNILGDREVSMKHKEIDSLIKSNITVGLEAKTMEKYKDIKTDQTLAKEEMESLVRAYDAKYMEIVKNFTEGENTMTAEATKDRELADLRAEHLKSIREFQETRMGNIKEAKKASDQYREDSKGLRSALDVDDPQAHSNHPLLKDITDEKVLFDTILSLEGGNPSTERRKNVMAIVRDIQRYRDSEVYTEPEKFVEYLRKNDKGLKPLFDAVADKDDWLFGLTGANQDEIREKIFPRMRKEYALMSTKDLMKAEDNVNRIVRNMARSRRTNKEVTFYTNPDGSYGKTTRDPWGSSGENMIELVQELGTFLEAEVDKRGLASQETENEDNNNTE